MSSAGNDKTDFPVALVGTTASGKSAIAIEVARKRGDVEIVSVDSMGVYRGMELATAKPSPAVRTEIRHHLIDLVDPWEEFTVSQFQSAARSALEEIEGRQGRALLVGGTGLYLRAVVDDLELPGRWPDVAAELQLEADTIGVERLHDRLAELDPLAASRTTPTNRRRIVRALEVTIGSGRPFSSFGPGLEVYAPVPFRMIGLAFDPPSVDQRIADRFSSWIAAGLVDEVRTLMEAPQGLSRTARQALGYREILRHLEEEQPLEESVADAVRRTRSFARRQWAWFRRDPRISWLGPEDNPAEVLMAALEGRDG